MAEANSNNFSVIEIMQMIKEKVKKENGDTSPFQVKERYTYDDFMQYDDEAFVKNLYRGLLKREADEKGLNIHLNLLRSGENTKSEIIALVSECEEGRNANIEIIDYTFRIKERYTYDDFTKYDDEEFVRNIYIGLLKREVDASGLENHLNLLRSGENSKSEIVSLLRECEEGQIANVGLSDPPFKIKKSYTYVDFTQYDGEEFVRNAYKGILKREADNDGLDYYLKFLKDGKKTKSEILSNMRYCEEGQSKNVELLTSPFRIKERYTYDDFTKYDDEEFVRNVYIGLLKREVDATGLETHLNLLKSGENSKSEIVSLISECEEGRHQNVELRP